MVVLSVLLGRIGALHLQDKKDACRPSPYISCGMRMRSADHGITDAHYWSWSSSASSLCEKSGAPPIACVSHVFLVTPTLANYAVGWHPGTVAPGGKHQMSLPQHFQVRALKHTLFSPCDTTNSLELPFFFFSNCLHFLASTCVTMINNKSQIMGFLDANIHWVVSEVINSI